MANSTRQVIVSFLDEVTRSGLGGGAKRHAAEDVTWWLPGSVRQDAFRNIGEVVSWFDARGDMEKLFRSRPEISVERIVVDGKLGAAQFRTRGVARSGKPYDNRYMLLMTIEDGKITEIREFYDTKHVVDAFHGG